jgi:hypothetical protein
MQKGRILGYDFGKPRSEHLREHESNDCDPGSTCAQAAVFRVQQRLAKPTDRTFSMSKFVEKTGYDDAD